jgi:hypothetical protein
MIVFIAEGKQAVRKTVTLGYEQDRMVEVLKGLDKGSLLIIKGQQLIKDGSTIRVVKGADRLWT